MAPKWEKKELNLLLRTWMIASGNPPNIIITATLKNNGFHRTIDQIEQKKSEFIWSYMLIRPHINTLDNIIENYCGKANKDREDEKEKVTKPGSLCNPKVPKENGSPTPVNDQAEKDRGAKRAVTGSLRTSGPTKERSPHPIRKPEEKSSHHKKRKDGKQK
ncbi:Hypothetical predicted protein [Octopus vulgaris]|uniref:Uncharacterized protein n=1 Tax=Octopus vulgaris TaxID=6645 RepID=A0AA36F736_OCTVU|nr:Hypothetical predicted protein [Octopus vulgaris]